MKTFISFLLLFLMARASAAPVETLSKSTVIKINKSEMRLVVRAQKTDQLKILQITSETRFFKDGKYAISEDVSLGDTVSGQVHKRADGVYEAVRLTIVKPKVPVFGSTRTTLSPESASLTAVARP